MFKKRVFVYIILVIVIHEINSSNLLRVKRQSRARRPKVPEVNATSIILETEERINNRTSFNDESSDSNGNRLADRPNEPSFCGGIFSQPQFIIETPNYPSNYPSNANCLYIFKGPYCSINYTLQFLDFNLEDSQGCINDRLEVKNRDAMCGSNQGFKTYFTSTGFLELNFISNGDTTARGFRILVSRSLCLNNPVVPNSLDNLPPTTTIMPVVNPPAVFIPSQFPIFTSTVTPVISNRPYLPPAQPIPKPPTVPGEIYYNTKEPSCCASTYSDKRFFLSSPGFPHSPNTPAQCSFTIYRANPKVCRLRIQIHYFWVGEQDQTCSRGYLQIDGKLICGCHTGLKLVSPFDASFGNTKVFRYMNIGAYFDGHAFSGFALEVIQDECPKRYLPDNSQLSTETVPRFNFYHDQLNRVGFPNLSDETLLSTRLFNGNTEIYEPIDLGFRPRVVKHVYFYDSPDYTYDIAFSYNKPRDVEETNYLETTDLHSLYPSGTDLNKCTIWNSNEWNRLNKDIAWQKMPTCNDISVNSNSYVPPRNEIGADHNSGCKEYSFLKGYFQSPGYPYYYPKNLNCCYRFYKQRGYCKIRLIMLDFQVEESYDCRKDYLLLNNNFRYCGQSLANTFTLFDMNGKSYEQIRFVTNYHGGGRGFRGIYEQIPCSSTEIPFTTTPLPPPYTPPSTSTPPPNTPCLRNIKDDYFTIDIYDYGKDMCNFDVYKANPSICRLEITFVTFDFPCELEYLEINGKQYCGNLSGEMIYMRFEQSQVIPIIYKRVSYKPGVGSGLKLHMVGRQSSTDCFQIPPAERILNQQVQVQSNVTNIKNSTMFMKILQKTDDVSVVLHKKHPEVCGVVMSIKEKKIESLCNIILNNMKSIDCDPITDNIIYVPYKNGDDKLELKFKDVGTVQDIEFKEITCDNKFIL